MKKIGLIGGLALQAGLFYYEKMVERHNAAGRTLRLVLNHADVGTVLAYLGAGDRLALGQYLGGLANELSDAGADIVAVTAVAPHFAIEAIARVARIPIVDVLDLIPSALASAGIERVAVFGNRAVMGTDVFGSLVASQVVRPEQSVIDAVHGIYSDIALSGKRGTPDERASLSRIAEKQMGEGAQAILLAGTDLSSFYAEVPPDFPYLDVASLHIDEIMRRAAGS